MRILVAIALAIGSLAVSGCSRWCSCPAERPSIAPQRYGQEAYSNSYDAPPQENSYQPGYSDDSYGQAPPSNSYGQRSGPSDSYLASPPNAYGGTTSKRY